MEDDRTCGLEAQEEGKVRGFLGDGRSPDDGPRREASVRRPRVLHSRGFQELFAGLRLQFPGFAQQAMSPDLFP